jgi:hypothetical protein
MPDTKTVSFTKEELGFLLEVLDYYGLGTLTSRDQPETRGDIREKLIAGLYPSLPEHRQNRAQS